MKFLMQLILVLALCGCATFHENAGRTLATTNVTVDAALNGWFAWVKAGNATAAQEEVVKDAYHKYQLALKVSRDAYIASVQLKDQNYFTQSVAALVDSREGILAIIKEFTSKRLDLPTNAVNP